MTQDRKRTGDWTGDQWAGDQEQSTAERADLDTTTTDRMSPGGEPVRVETTYVEATTVDGITRVDTVRTVDDITLVDDATRVDDTASDSTDRWVKTEWVGDQGEGAPAPVDPDTMPEGETSISGQRHGSGEQHWAGDDQARRAPAEGDRPLNR